jgi:hypothetical protein
VGKPEGYIPLERSESVYELDFTSSLKEIGWGLSRIDLAQNRGAWRAVVNAVMNRGIL